MRELSFDYIKGALIFLVIFGHAIIYISGIDCYYDPLWKTIYSFHMPLFVLLSGYFFKNRVDISFMTLCKKQFTRLILPQVSFVVLGFVLMPFDWNHFSYLIAINGNIDIKPLYHYVTFAWFLWCIFFCSLFVNFLTRILGKYASLSILLVCILMFVFFEYLPGPLFKNQQLAKQLLFFIIGIWFREYQQRFSNMKYAILLIAVLIISYYLPSLLSYKIHFVNYHNWMILALATCPVIYYLLKRLYELSFIKNIIVRWGQNSLGLYIIHVFFIRFIFTAFGLGFSTGYIYCDYAICFLCSIGVSYVIMKIIKLIQRNNIARLFLLGEIQTKKL